MERSGHTGRGVSWSHKETQALLALWSEDRIQRELEESFRNEDVYRKMSARLAAVGVNRSAKQCRDKMRNLKQGYRQFQQQSIRGGTLTTEAFEWYDAIHSVVNDNPAAATTDNTGQVVLELMISDVKTVSPSVTNIAETFSTSSSCSIENIQPVFPPNKLDDPITSLGSPSAQASAEWAPSPVGRRKDRLMCSWSKKEVHMLLTQWADPAVQQELRRSVRNKTVYNSLSAKLATFGFHKTAEQCREKLKKLKQDYKRIKNSNPLRKNMWFDIIDQVLSLQPAAAECAETATPSSAEPPQPVGLDVNTETPSLATSCFETCTDPSPTAPAAEISLDPDLYLVKLEDSDTPTTSTSESPSDMWSPRHLEKEGRYVHICSWSKKEVHMLLAYWAKPAVQQELRSSVRNKTFYNSLSAKLATFGFHKTAQQCKEKLKKLKQDYKRIKNSNPLRKNMWFDIIDQVLSLQPAAAECAETATPSSAEPPQPVGLDVNTETPSLATSCFETCTDPSLTAPAAEISIDPDLYLVKLEDSDTPTTSTSESPSDMWSPRHLEKEGRYVHICSWSKKEIHMLLAYWANPAVQQELRRNVRNKIVYNRLSAKLATFGFNKSPQQCKEKIKKLKHSYKRIKNSQNMGCRRSAWFGILDEVLGSQPAASKCSETPKPSSAEPTQPVGSDLKTNVSTDVAEWLPDEVQVLITLWAQPNIQKQLLASGKNNDVFTYLSNELALVGFSKTPQQCSLKVKKLEEEYKKIKPVEPHGSDGSDWFAIMDGILGPDGETSKGVSSSAALSASKSPEDSSQAVWTSDEVGALLTLWAEDSVQERLKSTQEDERVYAQLSSQLATQGFDKTTNQCRSKIRLLEQEYERIKEGKDSKTQKSSWFAIMDKIYGCSKPKVETKPAAEVTQSGPEFLQASLHDLPEPAEGCRLSIPSLCLLVPTLRLMCAFAWQVVQCCNVAHYQKVEELVVLVTELAPELLTARERVQLLLRLRARLVLELCRSESVANLLKIQPHLGIIQDLMMSSGCDQEELEELEDLEKSKSNFVEVVHTLLDNPEERKRFFTEVFPVHYGQKYEAELQALVWKFISRLDNLLPTPDIKQTAEWLSSAPSVMEECGQLVLEQEHLKAVLHFRQKQTGNTNKCFSQAQNMFLPVLSLHPKANSRRREASLGENEGLFNCGKVKELFEKSDALTVEESGKGNDLEDNQRGGNCSSLKPFQQHHCSMCSYSDSRLSALFQHIRQEHLLLESSSFNEAKDDILLNINAPLTLDSEISSDILKDEVTPVSKGPPFQCDKCEKKYVCKSSLVIHYRIHTGETPFLCSVCGRGFRVSYHLKQHTSIHTGERRFRCHICGKTSVQHLSRHMRMHRGEKNYLCTECGKAFLSTAELKLHMRSHTGERPYKCKHCGKGFTAKCQLTVHTRRHTGESPYKCSLCPKSFPTLRAQKKHLKIHTDKKSLQCLKCGKIFRQEDTFKLHIETHD